MSEEKEKDSETNFITTITEYLMNKYEPVNDLQQSDFISVNRILSEAEEIFGEVERFDLNSSLMMFWKIENVDGIGPVWLIKAKA